MSVPVGMVGMGAYLPAKSIDAEGESQLATYLRNETLLPEEYIEEVDGKGLLPGTIETNYDGWEKQPWFEAWLRNLPEKKRDDPF